MTLAFSDIPSPESPIQRIDARWKLAALLLAIFAIACLRTLPTCATAVAGAFLLVLLSRLPMRWYLTRIGLLVLLLALFTLPLPFIVQADGTDWRWGALHFSLNGLRIGLVLICKAVAIVTLSLVLLATSPFDHALKAAHSLRLPGLFVQLIALSYRYVFVTADEFSRLRIALRVRAFRNRANRHSYRTVAHVAGTLLVRSYERSERVAQAMRCRGFDGTFRSLTSFVSRPMDILAFALIVASAAALVVWDTL